MICVKSSLIFSSSSITPSNSFLQSPKPKSFSFSPITPKSFSSTTNFPAKMTAVKAQTVEHIVLFKVKEDTDKSKIESMIKGLNDLSTLDQVLHLTAGPILRNKSLSPLKFTHLIHSRYKTKDDLSSYNAHPNHMSVVKQSVFPICEDVMAVDWVGDVDESQIVPKAGSVLRVKLLKLKEGIRDEEKSAVLGVIGGLKDQVDSIEQISFGENFSPVRAKGFSIGSLAFFTGLIELNELDANEKVEVKEEKDKVKGSVEGVIVVDYVVPAPAPLKSGKSLISRLKAFWR